MNTPSEWLSRHGCSPMEMAVSPSGRIVFDRVNHLLAAPELTREQSAIFRIKGEKIHIF